MDDVGKACQLFHTFKCPMNLGYVPLDATSSWLTVRMPRRIGVKTAR